MEDCREGTKEHAERTQFCVSNCAEISADIRFAMQIFKQLHALIFATLRTQLIYSWTVIGAPSSDHPKPTEKCLFFIMKIRGRKTGHAGRSDQNAGI